MGSPRPEDSYVLALWASFHALEPVLIDARELALLVDAQSTYSKAMVIAAGNWCERRTCEALGAFASTASGGDERIISLVTEKAIRKQYHGLFDWDSGNTKKFLSLFGEGFKKAVLEEMKRNPVLQAGSSDFMVLGAERNLLAHDRKIDIDPQFTVDEVRAKFVSAAGWIAWIEGQLIAKPEAPPA